MGSFNTTCGISGIEIGGGSKARLIFITKKKEGWDRGCNCYPTDQWYPISFAIPVEYDDYGTYKINEKGLEWTGFRFFIAQELHMRTEQDRMRAENEKNPDTYSYFDLLGVKKTLTTEQIEAVTPEKVFEMIHEGKLFLSDGNRVDVFPIKQEIWDKWAIAPFNSYLDKEMTLDILLADTLKEVKEYVDSSMESFEESMDGKEVKDKKGVRKHYRAQALYKTAKYNYNILDYDYPWELSAERDFKKTATLKTELYMLILKMSGIAKMFHPQMTGGGVDKALHNLYSLCGEIVKKKYNDRQLDLGYEEKMIS